METILAELSDKRAEEREEWVLAELEHDPIPVDKLLAVIRGIQSQGHEDEAVSLAELLRDTLAGKEGFADAARAGEVATSWSGTAATVRDRYRDLALQWFEKDRERKMFVENCGFDNELLPASECMRRLSVLLSLEPERLCFDKTWGFGIVQRVDAFYKRVEIHFKKKRGHEMSFAYAAETLDLIDDEHILAQLHHDPAGMAEKVKKDAAEVVRMALRSYGPLNVAALQEAVEPSVIPAGSWKKFWDSARKVLKQDPLVEIPSKRNEPIQLLDKEMSYDEDWFRRLKKERMIPTILELVEGLLADEDPEKLDAFAKEVLQDRLAFVIKGAAGKEKGVVACALMQAHELLIDIETLNASEQMEAFYEPAAFLDAASQLTAREFKDFVEYLANKDSERTTVLMENLIPRLPIGPLQEVIDALIRLGKEDICAKVIKALVDRKVAKVDVLAWISKNLDRVETWSLGDYPTLVADMLTILEEGHTGEQLRGHNQLVGQFEDPSWLQTMLEPMTDPKRRWFLSRMKDTPAFPEMDRRSVLGKIIKLFPELEQEMVAKSGAKEGDSGRPQGRFTSERSHRERQLQLEKLVKEDIPNNSKEIGVARSYGDLKENHEFKAAKEMQTILLRREGELQQMLSEVMPTDFTGFPANVAGIGTGVTLAYEDGHKERYFILGEWDRDEDLGIIGCTTRMAKSVEGYHEGDTITAPTEDGETSVVIEQIEPLSDDVRRWAVEEVPSMLSQPSS